ncbi:MAG: SHOCT domain-containing protein [Leptospiraceae bacterium]|nr:SHOCT domain-containing protein [Leptospiraceae bacterium]
MKVFLIVYIFVLLFTNCSIFQRTERKIIGQGEEFVVFEMEKPIEIQTEENKVTEMPPAYKTLLLNSLKSIATTGSILGPVNIALIQENISEKLTEILWRKIQEKDFSKIYQVIIRKDDKLAPETRIFRTKFFFYADGNGINLIFIEANQNINFGNQYNFVDWANPLPLDMKSSLTLNSIISVFEKPDLSYQFQDRNGKPCGNKTIDKENTLACKKIVFFPSQESTIAKKDDVSNIEKRLSELKKLYDKKLINKSEYESKKKEILDKL